jgi:hypothetical protein
MILSEKLYNLFKWLVQIVFPSVSALYVGLAALYGWSNADKVAGTLALVAVFLGAVIGISAKNYRNSDQPYDGRMVVTTSPEGRKQVSLELDGDPHEIADKKTVAFRVDDRQDYAGMDLDG